MLENVKDNEAKQLLLVTLDGQVYGIWEDAVLAIEDLRTVHHLPVSLPHIAGVSIRNDHAITLADLAVCLGHAAMEKRVAGHLLIMSDKEKIAGFAIECELRRTWISPRTVLPLPEFLSTAIIDSCVSVESMVVPVVNLSALYSAVQHLEYQPLAPPCVLPAPPRGVENHDRVRTFSVGSALFSASTEGIEERTERPGRVTTIMQTPRFVHGIQIYRDRLLCIIDLEQRIFEKPTPGSSQMLVAEISGALFGFLINEDRGFLEKEDYSVKPLPPIAQSSWLRSAIEHAGEILPLIDPEALLSCKQAGKDEKPLPEQYAPANEFPAIFTRQDTEVVEFSLLGHRHALPKSEVKDSIGFKPYRSIPNVPEIVIGVAVDNDELLPVLDLAMVFGRRSLVTPEWRMLKIVNGDFRALVITEAVYAEQRLPVNIQREVPIKLPQAVVYGCYPDADTVRLILNVEALAVYFEKALVQELVPSMTLEMKQARAEIVPSLLGESFDTTTYRKTEKEPATEQNTPPDVPALQSEQPLIAEPEPEPEPEPQLITAAILNLGDVETAAQQEKAELPNPEQTPEVAKVVSEPTPLQDEERVTEAALERQEESQMQATEVPLHDEPVPSEAIVESLEEPVPDEVSELSQESALVSNMTEEQVADTAAPAEQAQASPVTVRILYHQETQPLHHEQVDEQSISLQTQEEEVPAPGKKWRTWFGVAAAIVLGVFLWQMDSMQKKKLGQIEKPAVAVKQKQPAQIREREPLVLIVPADVKIEIDKYIVKQGDTLWDISKRFTGNPFNYPGIAGENRITDPDLIYPEQKIIIKKQDK